MEWLAIEILNLCLLMSEAKSEWDRQMLSLSVYESLIAFFRDKRGWGLNNCYNQNNVLYLCVNLHPSK